MSNAKSNNLSFWESIELQHLRLFEHSRKEIESRLEDARKTNDKRYEDIGKRFEESRVKFEGALAELRQVNKRMDSTEMSWKEDLKFREKRFEAIQTATEARHLAERLAAEARLERQMHDSEAKLERQMHDSEARLEKERKEFNAHKRWMIANFLVLFGIFVAIVVFLVQAPHPPLFAL